jgi:hypothetical protein
MQNSDYWTQQERFGCRRVAGALSAAIRRSRVASPQRGAADSSFPPAPKRNGRQQQNREHHKRVFDRLTHFGRQGSKRTSTQGVDLSVSDAAAGPAPPRRDSSRISRCATCQTAEKDENFPPPRLRVTARPAQYRATHPANTWLSSGHAGTVTIRASRNWVPNGTVSVTNIRLTPRSQRPVHSLPVNNPCVIMI